MARIIAQFADLGPLFIGDLEPRSNHVPYLEHPQARYVELPTVAKVTAAVEANGGTVDGSAATLVAAIIAGDVRRATVAAQTTLVEGVDDAAIDATLDVVAPRIVETGPLMLSFDRGVVAGYLVSRVWVTGVEAAPAVKLVEEDTNNTPYHL